MRKYFKGAVVIAAIAWLFGMAGCGQTAEKTKETIKIGVNYELSGAVAEYGTKSSNGTLLAIEEINKDGGVLGTTLEPIRMDNKSDNAEAVSVAARLAQKGIVAYIGPCTTGKTLAASEIATKNKLPLVTPTATDPSVTVDPKTNETKKYIFRTCFLDPFQGTVMAKFASAELKCTKAAILMDTSNDYSKGLAKAFEEAFVQQGGTIVAKEGYVEGDKDFKATLTKIRGKNPEVIFVPGYYNEAGLIVKQGRELGINVPFIGGDGWGSDQLVKIAGAQALNNTFFCNHFASTSQDPKVQKFVAAYKAKYGTEPDAFAALGYDAAYLLADAIKRAGAADPEKITKALAETKNLPGVTGTLTMDKQHNPVKTAIVIELKDGKQVVKTEIKP